MSSTTPAQHPRPSSASSPSPSLTERRKAETRMEIARAAADLFVRHGLRGTRAEDIAQAAGIAPRTFYRYFAGKEEAVAPLCAAGAQRWVEAVRAAPAGLSLPAALEHAVRHMLTPGAGVPAASWEWVRTLIRLCESSPALRKVWAEVCRASEDTLAEVLAERESARGSGSHDNVAGSPPPGSRASRASRESWEFSEPSEPSEFRFTAAVASAVVRVAVESWAAGTAPATGPEGPAELALRNLEALRALRWG
ncbi:TetR/AcrR family transcriptional regulator [Streptomyces cinereospinus]|uniref:TetR/AcrR family transcriptional regulator n=1 Tax=Streptomyces cinereospinus TaxID=285561 RepID=A0ABV5N5Q6_9ACTN